MNDVGYLGSGVREQRFLIDQDEAHVFGDVDNMRYILAEVLLGDLLLLARETVEPRVYGPPGIDVIHQSFPEGKVQPREIFQLPV